MENRSKFEVIKMCKYEKTKTKNKNHYPSKKQKQNKTKQKTKQKSQQKTTKTNKTKLDKNNLPPTKKKTQFGVILFRVELFVNNLFVIC